MTWLFSKALMVSVNLPCSPEPEAESSEATYSDGEPSAQWNVMPTPQGFWRNDRMMGASRLSQFGPTLRLLTEQHGEAVLMSFLEGFPARTSAPAETKPESPEAAADSGKKCSASFVRLDLDTCSWKTSQRCLIEGWETFSATWPKQGLMLDGECWVLPMLAVTSSESECGLWPALKASDGDQYSRNLDYFKKRAKVAPDLPVVVGLTTPPTPEGYYGRINPEFAEWLMEWPAGWTALESLETAKIHEWQQQHSPNWLEGSDAA